MNNVIAANEAQYQFIAMSIDLVAERIERLQRARALQRRQMPLIWCDTESLSDYWKVRRANLGGNCDICMGFFGLPYSGKGFFIGFAFSSPHWNELLDIGTHFDKFSIAQRIGGTSGRRPGSRPH